jgi:predicted DNA-binding transcriptional regulator AlpA
MNPLTVPEVHMKAGLGRVTIWCLERAERFAKQRAISGRARCWIEAEIVQWIKNLKTDPPFIQSRRNLLRPCWPRSR